MEYITCAGLATNIIALVVGYFIGREDERIARIRRTDKQAQQFRDAIRLIESRECVILDESLRQSPVRREDVRIFNGGDHFIEEWRRYVPKSYEVVPDYPLIPVVIPQYPEPIPLLPWFQPAPPLPIQPVAPSLTPEEVADLKALLDRAKKYDAENNEPECELEEKKKN